jgi:hypothetical protein
VGTIIHDLDRSLSNQDRRDIAGIGAWHLDIQIACNILTW